MDDLRRAVGPALMGDGHQVSRKHLRVIGSGGGRAGNGSPQGRRQARLRRLEPTHARLPRSGAAIARSRRRAQCQVPLPRSPLSWLQHASAVALDIVRRPKATPIHELERYMRCKDCSRLQGRPYKRSHLVALRQAKISAGDPASTWWPGEQ